MVIYNKKPIGFNRDKKEDSKKNTKTLENYLDKWVFFKLKDGSSVAGYVENMDFGSVNLLPYQKMSVDNKGRAHYEIESNSLPYSVSRDFIGSFREISKKEAENFCEFLNRKLNSEFINQEQQKINYFNLLNNQKNNKILQVPENYDLNNLRD